MFLSVNELQDTQLAINATVLLKKLVLVWLLDINNAISDIQLMTDKVLLKVRYIPDVCIVHSDIFFWKAVAMNVLCSQDFQSFLIHACPFQLLYCLWAVS